MKPEPSSSSGNSKRLPEPPFYLISVFLFLLGLFLGYAARKPVSDQKNNAVNKGQQRAFNPYFLSGEKLTEDQTLEFKKEDLQVSFRYPEEYQLINSDFGIFINTTSDPVFSKTVNNLIKCKQSNKIDPVGICREGPISDMEVSIGKTSGKTIDDPKLGIFDFGIDYYENDIYCEKSKNSDFTSKGKTVFQCLRKNLAGEPEPQYVVFWGKNSSLLKMSLTVMHPIKDGDGVMTIIQTLQ